MRGGSHGSPSELRFVLMPLRFKGGLLQTINRKVNIEQIQLCLLYSHFILLSSLADYPTLEMYNEHIHIVVSCSFPLTTLPIHKVLPSLYLLHKIQ